MNSQANLQPGPLNCELLFLHQEHRAYHLFNGTLQEGQLLARRCDNNFWKLIPFIPDRVMTHIEAAGFGGVIRVGHIQLDHSLITALVERWRSETHTFHFPIGEATITLQDVQVLFGLNVEGNVVSGIDKKPDGGWQQLCEEMMGITSPRLRKGQIYLAQLHDILSKGLPYNASEEDCKKMARMYIMHLIGGFLLPDSSSSCVYLYHLYNLRDLSRCGSLSWGSAALAFLYRKLCKASNYTSKEISGPLVLLQLWAWERLPIFRPVRLNEVDDLYIPYGARWNCNFDFHQVSTHTTRAYRDQLAVLNEDGFIWTPYSHLPNSHASWRSVTYLICWEIVEPHLPNRVLRQFGMSQPIPEIRLLHNHRELHKLGRSGRDYDWYTTHLEYISHWENRLNFVEDGDEYFPIIEYMRWYYPRTVIYIKNPELARQNVEGYQPAGHMTTYLVRSFAI